VNLFWALDDAAALGPETEEDPKAAAASWRGGLALFTSTSKPIAPSAPGAALMPDGARVLTYCNTGSLATAGHGTALGSFARARPGQRVSVIACETRPISKGTITAWN